MCRQLTMLAKNDYQQAVMICEHDTIHLVNHYTTVRMTRYTFHKLDEMLRSRCLTNSGSRLRFKQTDDGNVELWIGKGAFALSPVALFALVKLVETAADRLRTTPLADLIGAGTDSGIGRCPPPNPSLN